MMKTLCRALIAVGTVLAAIGVFYILIKAGLPYQDPTLDMQIDYLANQKAGRILFLYGVIIFAIGFLLRLIDKNK
jgi:hypothetical protein